MTSEAEIDILESLTEIASLSAAKEVVSLMNV